MLSNRNTLWSARPFRCWNTNTAGLHKAQETNPLLSDLSNIVKQHWRLCMALHLCEFGRSFQLVNFPKHTFSVTCMLHHNYHQHPYILLHSPYHHHLGRCLSSYNVHVASVENILAVVYPKNKLIKGDIDNLPSKIIFNACIILMYWCSSVVWSWCTLCSL